MRIRLAFSPDSDDIFMFWALLSGKIDSEGLVFEADRADTETLNARAAAGDLDVVAVSIARYPAIARDYLLLRHGMSVGRGYGPVVVAPHARETSRRSKELASAYLVCERRRTWSCACSCPASSRWSCPSARTPDPSRPYVPARSMRCCSFTRAVSLTSARASRASVTSARAGRARPEACRFRSAGTRSAVGLGPELVRKVSRLCSGVHRVGAGERTEPGR